MLMAVAPALAHSASGLTPFRAAILGVVQGLTEFLPISSSAHLYLVPTLLGWTYEGVSFDVALHGGTLIALLLAYGRDFLGMARDLFVTETRPAAARLWAWLIVATVPGAIAGKFLEAKADALRSIPLQATLLLVFGVLLWAADRFRPKGDAPQVPSFRAALGMGIAQALALAPGVSRSGVTITAGRLAGLNRVSAARFSFLLATPITFGAVLLKARHMPLDVAPASLAAGVIASAVVGLITIRALIRWLGHAGFGAFLIYRAALAVALFAYAFAHR
jgi:undecaprenyl-diphosphatase